MINNRLQNVSKIIKFQKRNASISFIFILKIFAYLFFMKSINHNSKS